MRQATYIVATLLLVGSAPLVSAGGPDDPEIEDPTDDVNAQHLAEIDLDEPDTPDEPDDPDTSEETSKARMERAADIERAWVARETDRSFTVVVNLVDLPEDDNVPSPLAEIWTHFTLFDETYHVETELAPAQAAQPLQAKNQLYKGSSDVGTLTGNLDTDTDRVWFTVTKTDVGDPQPGDTLTDFYVTTHVPQEGLSPASSPILDYAPGAEKITVSSETDPTAIDPTALGLQPGVVYGDDYTFGDFQGVADLRVQLSPPSLTVTAGQEGRVALMVQNGATQADTAYLELGNGPSDWSTSLTEDELSIGAGESERAFLEVQPPRHASGQAFIDVRVTSDLGADHPVTVSVTVDPAPQDTDGADGDGSGGSGSTGADGSNGDAGSSPDANGGTQDGGSNDPSAASDGATENGEEENGAPAPAVWLVAAAMAAAALVAARRRR